MEESLYTNKLSSNPRFDLSLTILFPIKRSITIEALFQTKYYNLLRSDNTYWIDRPKGGIGGRRGSPMIFILLLEPQPELSISLIVLGMGTWTVKLGFVHRFLIISRKEILELDIGRFSVSRSILKIYTEQTLIILGISSVEASTNSTPASLLSIQTAPSAEIVRRPANG